MLNISNYSEDQILRILHEAIEFSEGRILKAKKEIFVSNLFFENSTRTKTSFDVAERKLGLQVVPFDVNTSSLSKGESLYDTIKTLETIGIDLVVVRHQQNEFYKELQNIQIPIVNGGDGTGNHPSQTMLDLMTIYQEFGTFKNLKIAICGDVKHSRVANSAYDALEKLGAKVYFSGPEIWFDKSADNFKNIDELIEEIDVLMLLRIQHERHNSQASFTAEEYLQKFGLNKSREAKMKSNAIIMHPAPINRGVEIDTDLVECEKSRIFNQMQNGVFARMAILKNALEKKGLEFF